MGFEECMGRETCECLPESLWVRHEVDLLSTWIDEANTMGIGYVRPSRKAKSVPMDAV
jgi:hypothetical protein